MVRVSVSSKFRVTVVVTVRGSFRIGLKAKVSSRVRVRGRVVHRISVKFTVTVKVARTRCNANSTPPSPL